MFPSTPGYSASFIFNGLRVAGPHRIVFTRAVIKRDINSARELLIFSPAFDTFPPRWKNDRSHEIFSRGFLRAGALAVSSIPGSPVVSSPRQLLHPLSSRCSLAPWVVAHGNGISSRRAA